MKVAIEFCVMWNYESRAVGLAAAIREKFPQVELEMIRSSGGRFEVRRDGVLVFSKKNLGRHAKPGEVLRLLDAADTST